MTPRGEFSRAVKEAAIDRADDLFRQAWGDPVRPGKKEWRAKASGAYSMQMQGANRGLWTDFRANEGGDILDFVAVQFCGLSKARDDFPRVLDEAARLCGVTEDTQPDYTALEARRAAREADAARQEAIEGKRKADLIAALVPRSEPLSASPAAAYLASRGITELPPGMSYLPPVPGAGVLHPDKAALVAWATDEAGTVRGGQRILVNPDGSPASVAPRKPAFGSIGGFPYRIAPKATGGPLVICEGPETAASVWLATGFETWAVFGATGFESAPLPRGRKVILCPDQDAPGSPAANAFDKACLHHAARGVDQWIAYAPEDEGSKRDLNDTLQRAGVLAVASVVNSPVKFTPRDGKGRFIGGGAIPTDKPAETPVFMAPDEARKAIRHTVETWAAEAAGWSTARTKMEKYNAACERFEKGERKADPDMPPDHIIELAQSPAPVLAIAATPGTGKSTITREVLAGFDLSRFGGDVVFHAPTLGLADEAAGHSAEVGGGSHVTRGRGAKVPGAEQAMCLRSELAEATAKAGLRVKPTLCERKDKETDDVFTCPHAASCAYLSQWANLPPAPAMRFEAAQYLTLPGDGSERETGARVIDESIWRLFTRIADLTLDAWTRQRTPQAARGQAQVTEAVEIAVDATQAASDVLRALQAGLSPVLDRYTAEDFDAFAAAERGPDVLPTKPSATDEQIMESLKAHAAFDPDAQKRAAVWSVLADCKRRGIDVTERLQLVRDVPGETGEKRDLVRVTWFAEPPRDKPVLLLDADITPDILERLYPGAEIARFDLKPNAEVVQLTNRMFSNAALKRPETRREVAELVRAEVYRDQGKGVLAIATRKAVLAMFEDAGHDFTGKDKAEVSAFMMETPLHGAQWLWFGPASLGRNDWQDFGTALVFGREELPVQSLEDLTRAMFGDTDKPLQLVAPDERGNMLLPEAPLPVTMADGSAWAIQGRVHPDPRGRAVQIQAREMATRQAIERLRLVNADEPKRVVIATKVPVPGLPVSQLVTFDELKPNRLEAAIAEAAQRGGVLRLSAAGLATDAPETFPSVAAAKDWLHKGGADQIKWLVAPNSNPITGSYPFNPVFASLRLKGQRGRETKAFIVVPGDPQALAEAQLGQLATFTVPDEPLSKPDETQAPDRQPPIRLRLDLPRITDATITEAEAAELVPHDDMIWRRAEKSARTRQQDHKRKDQERRWRDAGRKDGPRIAGNVVAEPVAVPKPSRRLIIVPEPERIAARLSDPVSHYRVEPDGVRLVWTAALADTVDEVFRKWGNLSEHDPDAWA